MLTVTRSIRERWSRGVSSSKRLLAAAAILAVAVAALHAPSSHAAGVSAPSQLTVAFNNAITTLDPDKVIANADLNALHMIGGGLYEQRSGGKIVPALAARSSTSPNGLTWTFTLRHGFRFSDGAPVTSADVVASFQRAMGDKSNINGAVIHAIKEVSARGPYVVVLKVSRPFPSLPSVLSEEGFMVMPKSLIGAPNFFRKPVSYGPYELVAWNGPTAEFKLNPYYWGPRPVVKTVTFRTVSDPASAIAQLESGQVDFVFDIPPSFLGTLAGNHAVHTDVVPSYGYYSLSMWNQKAPLSDVRVRRAISLAINRDELTKVVWDGRNRPLAGYMPSTMQGYDPAITTKVDVPAARRELRGTSCAHGCNLTLDYSTTTTPWAGQAALLIANNLSEIGIHVSLVQLDGTTFDTDLFDGKYQLGLYGLADFIPQPDGLLPYGLSPSGGVNADFSGYSNPEMEKLIGETLAASGTQRAKYLLKVNELFEQQQPFATLATWAYISASREPAWLISDQPSLLMEIARQGGVR